MWISCIVIAIAAVSFIVHSMFNWPSLRTIMLFRKLPGPSFIPLLGVAQEAAFAQPWELLEIIARHAEKFPRLLCAYLLGVPFVVLQDPDDVKVFLSSSQHIDKGTHYSFLELWLSEGLITSNGDKWRARRKLINPTFHVKILEDNVGNFWKNAHYMVKCMVEKNGQPFNLSDFVYPCALDIICETTMGVTLNAQKQQNKEYTNAIARTLHGILFRIMNPYLMSDWMWYLTPMGSQSKKDLTILHKHSEKVVRERMENYKPNKEVNQNYCEDFESAKRKERQPFLEKLVEMSHTDPETWKIEDIREEVDTVMFAGHDTSSGTAAFAMWILGHRPEIQENAYEELYQIFGDDDRAVTIEDLHRMHYLEKIIKETLRRYPIVPMIMRTLRQDVKLEGAPLIPAGVNIFISPYLLHNDETLFPEPNVFDPERFAPEECAKRHPFSYIPFSAGPRSCIGQKFAMYELKVILSTVIRFLKITSVTKEEDVKFIPSVVLHTSAPLQVRVEPRELRSAHRTCISGFSL